MVKLFVTWLRTFGNVSDEDITLRLHLHEQHRHRESEIIAIWSKMVTIAKPQFGKTFYKKHNPKTVRSKTDETYIGLVSVRVKRSTELNRRIMGWIYAIIATQK